MSLEQSSYIQRAAAIRAWFQRHPKVSGGLAITALVGGATLGGVVLPESSAMRSFTVPTPRPGLSVPVMDIFKGGKISQADVTPIPLKPAATVQK